MFCQLKKSQLALVLTSCSGLLAVCFAAAVLVGGIVVVTREDCDVRCMMVYTSLAVSACAVSIVFLAVVVFTSGLRNKYLEQEKEERNQRRVAVEADRIRRKRGLHQSYSELTLANAMVLELALEEARTNVRTGTLTELSPNEMTDQEFYSGETDKTALRDFSIGSRVNKSKKVNPEIEMLVTYQQNRNAVSGVYSALGLK